MINVLMIGAGGRAKNNFMPVLRCLRDKFSIDVIHSRTLANARAVADRWQISAVERLSDVDFSRIQLVIISIPYKANPSVLQQLYTCGYELDVLIDTPIFSIRQLRHRNLLKSFRCTFAAEDYMNFPEFVFARAFVSSHKLGRVHSVHLINTGYRYHALAAARSFFDFLLITRAQAIVLPNDNYWLKIYFGSGRLAFVSEPNRRFNGGWAVVGSEGILATDEHAWALGSKNLRKFKLSRSDTSNGGGNFFTIRSNDFEMVYPVASYDIIKQQEFDDKSEMNMMRNCGLVEILESIAGGGRAPVYSAFDGVYDSIASTLARQATRLGSMGTRAAFAALRNVFPA
jgi:hypothetical protein